MARLHQAAAAGDVDKVQAYLNEGDDPNDMSEILNSYGMKPVPGDGRHGGWGRNVTALHLAAYNGHTSVVRLLVAEGANLEQRDAWRTVPGRNAFEIAIANRFISCARTLKELGAKDTANVLNSIFNNIDIREWLAHAAIYKQPSHIQELYAENLVNKEMGEIGLRLAAQFNAIEVAELLITQYEVSPNAFNYNEPLRCGAPHDEHKTPLGLAAEYGHVEMTTFLLQKGASINQPTHLSLGVRDSTPLRVALCEHRYKKGHSKIIELLLKHGADATKITEEYLQKLLEDFISPTTSFAKSVTKQNHPIWEPVISSKHPSETNLNDGNNPSQETSCRIM